MKINTGWPGISAVAMTLFLTARGSDEVKQAAPECVFPDATSATAPGWICDEPVEGVAVSAVGVAEKSAAGHSFMKNMAATDARVQLAQSMKVHVQNMVKQYAETTGAADSETVDNVIAVGSIKSEFNASSNQLSNCVKGLSSALLISNLPLR